MKKALILLIFPFILFSCVNSNNQKSHKNTEGVSASVNSDISQDEESQMTGWALESYEKAQQGDPEAQYSLGVDYYEGVETSSDYGVPRNYEKAVYWFQKAIEQGNTDAMTFLAICYYNGQGVPKDTTKSIELWRKAARLGDKNAQMNLEQDGYSW